MTTTAGRTTTLRWQDIAVGDEVTALEIPITTTMIVAGAIATRDFMPVHHDRDYAKQQGSPNLFMNILTTNGYCVRFLTDWAGPEAMVSALRVRLGAPAYPYLPLTFSGSVQSIDAETGRLVVAVQALNELGPHVTGTVELELAK